MNKQVVDAIENLKIIDAAYWVKTLEQRLPGGAGSVVRGYHTGPELEAALKAANWEPYSHPALLPGCIAFVTKDILGWLGLVALKDLTAGQKVVLDDRKEIGRVSATVKGVLCAPADYTVIILGKEHGALIVFTLHPGDPIVPSTVETSLGLHGKEITREEALKMGFDYAYIPPAT